MKAAALRDEITDACVELAWDQWSQLGVSGARPRFREERAADPEALLLFTLEVGRHDPRLFDEVLDWLALNEGLISVQRLRNLCATRVDTALVDAALGWSTKTRRPHTSVASPPPEPPQLLFPSAPPPGDVVDDVFLHHGFARAPLAPSGKSQAPRLDDPISFALRLRRLLGIGVRAEVVRALLTIRAPWLSGKALTASAAFAQRNVREGLTHLVEAGVVQVVEIADDRHYSIHHAEWAAMLGLAAAPDLPFYYDWIAACRALVATVRWLHEPETDGLSEYLLASQARTLVEQRAADLQLAGVPMSVYPALGLSYWDEFVEISRRLVRLAGGGKEAYRGRAEAIPQGGGSA